MPTMSTRPRHVPSRERERERERETERDREDKNADYVYKTKACP